MPSFSFVFFVTLISLSSAKYAPHYPKCRCTPSDPCYPTPAELHAFSASLSHPLLSVRPIGAPCHDPSFDTAACNTVLVNFTNGQWRADQPGASQYPNAEETGNGAQACLVPNPLEPGVNGAMRNATCEQGAVPLLAVDVREEGDVQKTVRFAAQHNLKIVVKNSGHGQFRSMGRNGLLIWTRHLDAIRFTAWGREHTPAVTIGAGVQWGTLYDAVAARGHTIIGGFSATGSVGAAGGWILGGGHSALSPQYGLGVDNVLQFRIVVADGRALTADAQHNTDLFWALRGGGGPSFGVVMQVTYRLHTEAPLLGAYFEAAVNTTTAFTNLLDVFHALQPTLADAGWAGFYPFSPGSLAFTYVNPRAGASNASIAPAFKQLAAVPGVSVALATTVQYPSFHAWYAANFEDASINGMGYNFTQGDVVAINGFSGSRLLPRTLFEDATLRPTLSAALAQLPLGGRGFLVGGGAVARVGPHDTAVTPAWRTALVDITLGGGYPDGTPPALVAQIAQNVSASTGQLRKLTPGGGTYLNEPDILEPDWQDAYWGKENYARLENIKAVYDPEDLLMAELTVGAERWDSTVDCQLRGRNA